MRRVVSLFLPSWPTDRVRRRLGKDAPPVEAPLVLVGREGRRQVVTAADWAARRVGISLGMPATQARALIAGLVVQEADPIGDQDALDKLAFWALKLFSPVVAADAPDGLMIDATGSGHLFGGEATMVADMVGRLRKVGVTAYAAIAPTYGAAHALARFYSRPLLVETEENSGARAKTIWSSYNRRGC